MHLFAINDEDVRSMLKVVSCNIIKNNNFLLIYMKNDESKKLVIIDKKNNSLYELKNSSKNTDIYEYEFGRDVKDVFGILRKEYSIKIDENNSCFVEEHPTIEKRSCSVRNIDLLEIESSEIMQQQNNFVYQKQKVKKISRVG